MKKIRGTDKGSERMDNRNITSIVVNYDNGEIETLNKGIVVSFDEIDNEEETIKFRYRMCDIKGKDLHLIVHAVVALAHKFGIFDKGGDDNEDD